MSFLTPILLAALPLAAIPILIHLLNQRRYQTVNWGAMQFLFTANKMSRGVARIRSWLILLLRTLAIIGLIIAVSRPLATGWLGAASGSKADTTILLVDRSPSMAQSDANAVATKLGSGISKLADTVTLVGSTKWVLIDSASQKPQELNSAAELKQVVATTNTSASANLPTLLEAAHTYIKENNCGQTNIWILSDLRENDWVASNGRWQTVREGFQQFPQQINFHLLAYPELPENNISVRVSDVRRQSADRGGALVVSVQLTSTREEGKNVVPLQFDIEGATSELKVEWEGPTYEVKDHEIAIESQAKKGWGRVAVPVDMNPADNDFYFAFADESVRRTVVVCEDPSIADILRKTAAASFESDSLNPVDVLTAEDLATVAWDDLSLLLWQRPLPTGDGASLIKSFVRGGGRVMFLPPATPTGTEFMGIAWTAWEENKEPLSVTRWRGDSDVLANTKSGAALPVGELRVKRFCGIAGDAIQLATLRDNAPLLIRLPGIQGGVYFLATTPRPADSSFAEEGVVLYAMVQRELADGANGRSQKDSVEAGTVAADEAVAWQQVAGPQDALSNEHAYIGGVYKADERFIAVNRSAAEDTPAVLADAAVDRLFEGLHFDRISDRAGSFEALTKEVWKLFLVGMMIALFGEAVLCLPKAQPAAEARR